MKNPIRNKYVFVVLLLFVLTLAGYGFVKGYGALERQEGEELLIVTSFYPVYVATLNVVGDCPGVRVENLSEPQTGCLHDYQLTPQDMILLSQADLFVVNGGGIEEFLAEVAEAYPGLVIVNSGVDIFGEGVQGHETNAHAWLSIARYEEQVTAIRDQLMKADPSHREKYDGEAAIYLNKIATLNKKTDNLRNRLKGQSVVILHEGFAFLAEDYGMKVAGELNLDEERQVSAGEMAEIIRAIKEQEVQVVFAEEQYGKEMAEALKKETGCQVIYLDTLVRGEDTAEGWLTGMEENIRRLEEMR